MTQRDGMAVSFVDRINMIKRIKKIGDCLGSLMGVRSFVPVIFLFFAFCLSACVCIPPKVNKISQEEAVKIAIEATKKRRALGHETIDAFRITALGCSSEINACTKDDPDSSYIKTLRAQLKGKIYWMVVFARKKLQPGGPTVVFVDQNNGKILGEYLGK